MVEKGRFMSRITRQGEYLWFDGKKIKISSIINYNGIRNSWDGIGFAAPQPFDSWTKNSETYIWEAPVAYPEGEGIYTWNEETTSWDEVTE